MSQQPKKEEPLSGMAKIGIVILVVAVGVLGCTRPSAPRVGSNERVRVLESRIQKLEQDYRTVAKQRDETRNDVVRLEEEKALLQKDVSDRQVLIQERDQLLAQLKSKDQIQLNLQKDLKRMTLERKDLEVQLSQRNNECNHLQTRVEKMRSAIKQMLAQDDSPAATTPTLTPTSTTLGLE